MPSSRVIIIAMVTAVVGCSGTLDAPRSSEVASAAGPEIVATIDEPDLIPEGIDWDPESRRLFVSSVYKAKIVALDSDGTVRDFVPTGAHGLLGGLGLRVDSPRGLLWAASAMGDQTLGHSPDTEGSSALHAFALDTGALVHRAVLDNDDEAHLLNDLVVGSDGDVYVTDTLTASIYRFDPRTNALTVLIQDEAIQYPNGIAWNHGASALFVAHDGGISRLPLDSLESRLLEVVDGETTVGIDGLYYRRGSLIAVQNHKGLNRVARFELDAAEHRVVRVEVLLVDDPSFDIPTTAAFVDDDLWILANSQLDRFEDGQLIQDSGLEAPRIIRIPLEF